MAISVGTRLGDYTILGSLGAGNMGEVYRARDHQLGREVALKILPESISEKSESVARFKNEARLASSLNHPNIVTIYAIGIEGQSRYIAMEFIDGATLEQLLEGGPMRVEQAVTVATQIAEGLAKAHEAGIVHRDLKPKNIMLTKEGLAKILDFGISKLTPTVDFDGPTISADRVEGVTSPGTIVGTVDYMSPEQAAGRPLDFRSDQFSFGSLLYTMLTARTPFHRPTAVQTLANIMEGEAEPLREINPQVPKQLEGFINRCLNKDPRERYASTQDLVQALRELHTIPAPLLSIRPRDWLRALVTAAVMLAAVLGLWLWNQRPYHPASSALTWYDKGVAALHSMTFEGARKALEQAVSADPKFALAYANLSRAYDELDYSDRARETMLRALAVSQEVRLSGDDEKRLRALQLIVSRDYERAAPLLEEIEKEADPRNQPAAALESGWLAQQRDDTEGAAKAFERALAKNPAYAAAKLHLGFIQGRRGQNEEAFKSFTEAENLYNAASDYEGITETLIQRANLLNRRNRAAEALPVIDRALAVARTVGNPYQQIRLQLLQGTAVRNLGDTTRAAALAKEAINSAVLQKMDNLAVSGTIDLANSYLIRRDVASAEPIFRSALDLARRGKVRRLEVRASSSLASLLEQKKRPAEAKELIEAALPFYRSAGYRREFVQSMGLLGGVLGQLGDFEQGAKVLREALPSAVQLQDTQNEAQLRARLTEILEEEGAWPEALDESNRTVNLLGNGIQSVYARLNSAMLYWRLGRPRQAEQSLSEAQALLNRNPNQGSLSLLNLRKVEIDYRSGRFEEAKANARKISAVGQSNSDPGLPLILALVAIRTNQKAQGIRAATNLIEESDRDKLAGSAASARLAVAEALVMTGDRSLALKMAQEALAFFEPRHIWEATWRAHVVAARCLDENAAEEQLFAARSAIAELRKIWSSGSVDLYLERPDIKALRKSAAF